jgi:hypothetical protein
MGFQIGESPDQNQSEKFMNIKLAEKCVAHLAKTAEKYPNHRGYDDLMMCTGISDIMTDWAECNTLAEFKTAARSVANLTNENYPIFEY